MKRFALLPALAFVLFAPVLLAQTPAPVRKGQVHPAGEDHRDDRRRAGPFETGWEGNPNRPEGQEHVKGLDQPAEGGAVPGTTRLASRCHSPTTPTRKRRFSRGKSWRSRLRRSTTRRSIATSSCSNMPTARSRRETSRRSNSRERAAFGVVAHQRKFPGGSAERFHQADPPDDQPEHRRQSRHPIEERERGR